MTLFHPARARYSSSGRYLILIGRGYNKRKARELEGVQQYLALTGLLVEARAMVFQAFLVEDGTGAGRDKSEWSSPLLTHTPGLPTSSPQPREQAATWGPRPGVSSGQGRSTCRRHSNHTEGRKGHRARSSVWQTTLSPAC